MHNIKQRLYAINIPSEGGSAWLTPVAIIQLKFTTLSYLICLTDSAYNASYEELYMEQDHT